ncbi:MAG: hypothetical protein M1404_01175 [Acidobacteria bacterium]|nr:hypothetical protein [Acidobacteriota bacterium]
MKRRRFLQHVAGSITAAPLVSELRLPAFSEPASRSTTPLDVKSERQLFIDDSFIAAGRDVRLVVNRPAPTGERCLVADKPWEGFGVLAYNSIMEDEGILKLWYDAIANDGSRWCCYATSKDGVHWEKPNLGIVPFNGRRDTNIVFPPERMEHEPNCVFKDTNPSCPRSERYKMVANLRPPGQKPGTYVAASSDGLHWKLMKNSPVFRPSDTNNICFFDDRIGKYVGYVRVWDPMRKVGRCAFDDITDWGKEQVVFSYDQEDQQGLDSQFFSGMDFYTSAALKYPHTENAYLMFPSAYYHYQEAAARRMGSASPRNDGPLDIQFATSRDGIVWKRLDRKPFIGRGRAGGFASGYAYMASGIISRPEEIWLYYAVADHTHGNYNIKRDKFIGTITRARLRLDGFVSVDADYAGGEFTTPPLLFSGRQLILNVNTGAGGCARVEIRPESGLSIKGFSTGDCDPINGNFVRKEVSWRGKTNLSSLAGKPVRLRFVINDTKLYSFKFE